MKCETCRETKDKPLTYVKCKCGFFREMTEAEKKKVARRKR